VSDQSQGAEQPEESAPADTPAALEPDPPTLVDQADEPTAEAATAPPVAFQPAPPPPEVPLPPPPYEAVTAPGGGGRPEVAVGAAFAGGLVLALILKRLAR
jgi:hypothetical protein